MTVAWTDFLVCPHDSYGLQPSDDRLTCPVCKRCFEIRDGIAMMLLDHNDEVHQRYFANYQKLAVDDLSQPLESRRGERAADFVKFVGSTSDARILDIGSGTAVYLDSMDSALKVAVDIAMPYLESMTPQPNVMRVCADAEHLPIAPGFFDVIILSGILEHVLSPETVVAKVHQLCRPDTRVIVLVPWQEDLKPYEDMPWEFTHLRSFDSYAFSQLWHQFRIVRRKPLWPRLADPLLFRVDERLPLWLFDFLRYGYFHRGHASRDASWRHRWSAELPRRERRLLRAYPPTFYEFELRTYAGSQTPWIYDRLERLVGFSGRILGRANGFRSETSKHP